MNPQLVLIIGAGRSATCLIDYLSEQLASESVHLRVADLDAALAQEKVGGRPFMEAVGLDLTNEAALRPHIEQAAAVVSLAPAFLHMPIARLCAEVGRSLFTASYLSEEMKALDEVVRSKDLVFMNELGCDPGIDHMSAMKLKAEIEAEGGQVEVFCSYTGGLVAEKSNNNPWGYKFSWNPRNVILAGTGGPARFLQDGKLAFIPYYRLFRETESFELSAGLKLDAYANRDSVPYRKLYQLQHAHTVIRGTFRYPGYCLGWQAMVLLGLTDDSQKFPGKHHTYADLLRSFLPQEFHALSLRMGVQQFLISRGGYSSQEAKQATDLLDWTGIMDELPLPEILQSPAAHLQTLLEPRWKLEADDTDRVIMFHHIEARFGSEYRIYNALLDLTGDDPIHTSMAKTVGWPLAMAVESYIKGTMKERGVCIPLNPEVYLPILEKLEQRGVKFQESYQVL